MNPESLDVSIQSALSALFPPFEATAPIVLSQLFRSIEERYHGDALQCLLDFLIPAKHLLESVQQAACAEYSDVVFRCEGWPLCLHDKTVVQLAPVNPLLLRPGDFYLQVEPFGSQAARIVLKSLLEEGCREVEETPLPETSYPCLFTEEWLRDINDGRHGTPLARCLLCTDQGVVKLPWAQIAVPEFLDKPKTSPSYREPPPEPKQTSLPSHFNSSTLPMEAVLLPSKDRMSASLRAADSPSKYSKAENERRALRSASKPLIKPVGWVSPNTWDSRETNLEIEGDYVDLVDVAKGKEFADGQSDGHANPVLFKPVRPPPPVPLGNSAPCGPLLQYAEEPCAPCGQSRLGCEPADPDLKCRYRESYVAALRNPVAFERGSVELLSALQEVGGLLGEDWEPGAAGSFSPDNVCDNCNKPLCNRHCKHKRCRKTIEESLASHFKVHPSSFETEDLMKEPPAVLKSTPGLSHSQRVHMKLISQQLTPGSSETSSDSQDGKAQLQRAEAAKPAAKHKVKVRSLSTVSETAKGSPPLYKLNNRSHSDICPETITSMMQCKKGELLDQVVQRLDRRKSPRKDLQSNRSETASATDSPILKVHNSKSERPPAAQVNLPSSGPDCPHRLQTEESSFRRISGLLELGIVCLPGSRDRTGRAVVEVHGEVPGWASHHVSVQSLCELLLYLHFIPRKEIRELGMTLVIGARRKPPPVHLYRALLMAQEQALHAVHSVVMLVDKDTSPRPEKHPGLQMDIVTSMKALNKTVEASQLTANLGGTFAYSHSDWLQFHMRYVSFMRDLRGADSLLQKAIEKVEDGKKLDTAQEVKQCIEEQRASMKEVLEDTRLVSLQREGGAVLARMRREDLRFPQSEDFRDAMESVTGLYNRVEEKLHTLVMRSNESLQHLEFLLRLREMEAKISTAGTWFSAEGEQRLNDSYTTDDTLVCTETAIQHFEEFLAQAKEKQQHASTLVTEAGQIAATDDSGPGLEIFRTLVCTFRSDVDDFVLRAEQRHKELETLANVHGFCQQASALAKDCSHFLETVEPGSLSASTLGALETYEERLGCDFSTLNFQAVKVKACALGSRSSAAMRVWNAAWLQCQEVRQHLEKMQKKGKSSDKSQSRRSSAASHQEVGEVMGGGGERGDGESPPTLRLTSEKEQVKQPETEEAGAINVANCETPDLKGGETEDLSTPDALPATTGAEKTPLEDGSCQPGLAGSRGRLREHRSDEELSRADSAAEGNADFPRQPLGRSLSEGSHGNFPLTPLNVRNKHCQPPPELNLPADSSRNCKSQGAGEEEGDNGCVASKQLSTGSPIHPETSPAAQSNGCDVLKLPRIMEELLSTEREYVKALGYVREHYFPELERADVPQDLRGQRGIVFGNLEKLHDFHQHHFLSELESCEDEPLRVGRCFLRHRESFALYALYSKNKPQSDSLFISHGQTFFKQKQLKLDDKMDLWSYLLKPMQRISKYSLLLQDMMRECGPGQAREAAEVKAALEVVHFQLRHGNNLLAMDAIRDCDVNLKEQGQLIRQDEFMVTFRKKKCFRHIFLFQELVLFSKTRKTDVGNDSYIYKQSFKTSDIGLTQNSGDSGLCFEIWFRKRKTQDTYTLQAGSRELKEAWTRDLERILWEQAVHNREVRMQERVFMGIGNKPFMDIQPSEAAISDRAVNCVLIGRDNRFLPSEGSQASQDGLPSRPKSVASGSMSSSSSSSGRGSLSPVGYMCGPTRRAASGGLVGYMAPPAGLEEDDLDHGGGSQNLLLDSSESSGESVSGFSSSGHSFHSAAPGEAEDASSVCSSTVTIKEVVAAAAEAVAPTAGDPPAGPNSAEALAEKPQPSVKPQSQAGEISHDKAQSTAVGKSTEV